MIILHTIKGQEFAINGGLIERVEQDNETHVTLATGTSYMVREPMAEVVHLHQLDRATVRVLAGGLSGELAPTVGRAGGTYGRAIETDDDRAGDDAADPAVHAILPFVKPGGRQSS